MAFKSIVCIVLTLTLSLCGCSSDDDFVNPSDPLNFDPVNIRMNNEVTDAKKSPNYDQTVSYIKNEMKHELPSDKGISDIVVKEEWNDMMENHCPAQKDGTLKSVFKRYLMSLVQHLEGRVESPDIHSEFCLKMRVSASDLMLLKLYGMGDKDSIHEIQETLEKMILYPTDLPNESPVYWLEREIGLSKYNLLMVIAILLLGLIAARMLSSVRVTRSLVTKGILIAFIVSCAFAYVELYQQKVADHHKILSEEITKRCPHLSDSSWSRFLGYFSSSFTFQEENCREYYEAVVVHPFFKVSLLEAGAIAITKTIVAPLKILGKGIKDFMMGLFKDLPIQYSWPLFTIMMVILILYPFLKFGYTLRTPFATLHPPAQSQQYLPPKEPKIAICSNCAHAMDHTCQVVGRDSLHQTQSSTQETTNLPAPANSLAIANSLPAQNTDSCRSKSSVAGSVKGDAGDCNQIVKKNSEPQFNLVFHKIVLPSASCEVINKSDPSNDISEKIDDLKLKDKKECKLEYGDEVSDPKEASNGVCVTNVDNLLNSNCFLNEEVRLGDSVTEIRPDSLPSERHAFDSDNCTEICLNELKFDNLQTR